MQRPRNVSNNYNVLRNNSKYINGTKIDEIKKIKKGNKYFLILLFNFTFKKNKKVFKNKRHKNSSFVKPLNK